MRLFILSVRYHLLFVSFAVGVFAGFMSQTASIGAPNGGMHIMTPEQYGGSPDANDNTAAFEAMISAAKSLGEPVEIRLEAGAFYRVKGKEGRECAVMISGARDLTLNGEGATLVITDPSRGGLRTINCERIWIKNLAIDYDPLPYTASTVTAVNVEENWFEIKIEDSYPSPGLPYFSAARSQSGMMVVPQPDGGTRFGPDVISPESIIETGDGVWRIYPQKHHGGYSDPIGRKRVDVGEQFVYCARTYEQALSSIECVDLLWENITIYSSPGVSSYPRGNERHTIRGYHVAIKEGRIFSTNADGIHMRGSRGDVLIEGCSFEGMGDDAINVHSSAMAISAQPANNQAEVRKHTYGVRIGDRVVAVNSSTAASIGEAEIVNIEDKKDCWILTFDRELILPEGNAGNRTKNEHGELVASVNLYNLDECASPFIIRDCVFNAFRGRGILVSAREGVIEDNIFRDQEGWGVVMNYESSRWAEGPIASNITIRNNTFIKPYGAHQPAIISDITARSNGAPIMGFFENISIENNVFYGWEEPIRMRFVNGMMMENNEIRPGVMTE